MAEYIFGASNRSSGDVSAQGQRQKITPERVFTVNELAGKHLGPVQLINVVAAIIQGRGFVLVNNCEYADSGLTCFSAPFSGSLGLLSRGQDYYERFSYALAAAFVWALNRSIFFRQARAATGGAAVDGVTLLGVPMTGGLI